jgi:hypothetical protein
MSESLQTVLLESIVMTGFLVAAVVGFKTSAWIVVVRWLATVKRKAGGLLRA